MPKPRFINMRVSPETWDEYEALKNKLRTSFQEIGSGLWHHWYAENKGELVNNHASIPFKRDGILTPTNTEEAEEVEALLRAKRSKDPLYAAISFMLDKFKVGGDSRASTNAQADKTSERSKRDTG